MAGVPGHYAAFRISYPSDWTLVPARGANVRFSVNPADGPGNCNVVARPAAALARMSQSELNGEIGSLRNDRAGWAKLLGMPSSQVILVESRRGRIHDIPAVVGVVEAQLENLQGKFVRKSMVAMTMRPGVIISLNCGATSFSAEEARTRYATLQPTFAKIFGSFAFLK